MEIPAACAAKEDARCFRVEVAMCPHSSTRMSLLLQDGYSGALSVCRLKLLSVLPVILEVTLGFGHITVVVDHGP